LHVKDAEFEKGKSLEADVVVHPSVFSNLLVKTICLIVCTKVSLAFR
jgi:hypothetical protein